jgi:co-chaperonin GroES (HSP10)
MKYPQPFGERILVRRHKIESKGCIIMPGQSSKNEGKIVALGEDTKEKPMRLSLGYNIMFSGYGTTVIEIPEDKDNQYLLMSQNDVLAILT